MRSIFFVSMCLSLFTSFAHAQSSTKGEAEAGLITISGANESESYNAKGKVVYTQEANSYSASGRYLRTNSNGVESARNWEAGLRYERSLAEHFSVYVGQKAESDVFNGYIQRDSSDAGLKYILINEEKLSWFLEAGYRYQKIQATNSTLSFNNLGRMYTEFSKQLENNLTFKYWAEYLPNFTDSEAYLANTEASMNVMVSALFSLKFAYLLQYQNRPVVESKYTTSTTTINLVAKF